MPKRQARSSDGIYLYREVAETGGLWEASR
jgi:hypothetical protein